MSLRKLLPKHQRWLTKMDDQILTLYAKGLSTRKIVDVPFLYGRFSLSPHHEAFRLFTKKVKIDPSPLHSIISRSSTSKWSSKRSLVIEVI